MRALLPNLFEELSGCCNNAQGAFSISEDEKQFYFDLPVPGVDAKDIEVVVDQEKRTLKIRAQAKQKRENVQYHLKGACRFFYEVPLSNAIDTTAPIEAICKDGILSVALPKSRAHNPLKIEVKVA